MESTKPQQVAFWANETDLKGLAKIQESTGIASRAELLRYCVRQAIKREGASI